MGGCLKSGVDTRISYFAPYKKDAAEFELIRSSSKRVSPDQEMSFVSAHDSKKFTPGDECYLISATWLDNWLKYASKKDGNKPGPITNRTLLNDRVVADDIKVKIDFRPVNKAVWEYLWANHQGGPVIAVIVPVGFDTKSYNTGSWIKKIDLTYHAKVVYPSTNARPHEEEVHNSIHVELQQEQAKIEDEPRMQMSTTNRAVAPFTKAHEEEERILIESLEASEKAVMGIIAHWLSLKARKETRKEDAVRRLQVKFRLRQAQSKKAATERALLQLRNCVKLQSFWRRRQAEIARANYVSPEQAAMTVVSRLLLILLAKIRFRNRMQLLPTILKIKLKAAAGISTGKMKILEPFVLISMTNSSRGTVSLYKTQTRKQTVNPTWENECCIVTNATITNRLMLTICNKADPATTKVKTDDFLGQCLINLQPISSKLWSGEEVNIDHRKIDSFKTALADSSGPIVLGRTAEEPGRGTLSLSIRMCSMTFTHSGYLLKQAGHLLGFSAVKLYSGASEFKRRYFLLCDNGPKEATVLSYFDDHYSLHKPRSSLLISDITELRCGPETKGSSKLILYIGTRMDNWYLTFCSPDSDFNSSSGRKDSRRGSMKGSVKEGVKSESTAADMMAAKLDSDAWLRKIQYACSKHNVFLNGGKGADLSSPMGEEDDGSAGFSATPSSSRRNSTNSEASFKDDGSGTSVSSLMSGTIVSPLTSEFGSPSPSGGGGRRQSRRGSKATFSPDTASLKSDMSTSSRSMSVHDSSYASPQSMDVVKVKHTSTIKRRATYIFGKVKKSTIG